MATKLKNAVGSATRIAGVEPVKLDRFITDIKRAVQEKNDATTNHASLWKQAKDAGVHTEALKLALRLDRMEDDKRNDFLRSLDQLRRYMGLDRALDLFDGDGDSGVAARETGARSRDGEGDPIGETGGGVHPEPDPVPGGR